MVEALIPEREVGGLIPTSRVVSLSKDTFIPRKVLVIPRKRWLRLDMTEKLFTGTLSHNKSLPPSMIIQAFMHVLITCKYGYDVIKIAEKT